MTRDGSGRGAGDRQHGSRSDAEVEDIHTRQVRPVARSRGPRLGVQGTLLAAAALTILAAGFGVLGGRPAASPAASVVAPRVTPRPTEAAPAPSPLVTPWSTCSAPPIVAPEVVLQVNGAPIPAEVEALSGPSAAPWTPGSAGELVLARSDVATEIWIVGGACANAWDIGVAGGEAIDVVVAPELDPAFAAQNRFAIQLAPFGGRDIVLRADLAFPAMVVRATWHLRIVPFERPEPHLRSATARAETVEGCDVEVTLGNGYESPAGCDDDLSSPLGGALQVARGGQLVFEMAGWHLMSATVACGHLSGLAFVAVPEPGCFRELDVDPASPLVEFTADFEGAWTLAISACAVDDDGLAANRVCGTWFVDVQAEG